MRMLVCVADLCGDLPAQIASATGIEAGERASDFVSDPVDPDTVVTLACGIRAPSSVGARHLGDEPPASSFRLFGQAGQVVTGIAVDRFTAAAQPRRGRGAEGQARATARPTACSSPVPSRGDREPAPR